MNENQFRILLREVTSIRKALQKIAIKLKHIEEKQNNGKS